MDDLSLGFLVIIIFLIIQVMYLLWKVRGLNSKVDVLAASYIDTYRALDKLACVSKHNVDTMNSMLKSIEKLDSSFAAIHLNLDATIDDHK